VETSYGKRTGIPLCFHGETFQKTHPAKQRLGYKDADCCCVSPMLVGVCDGVSQLEEFGMDPSELPRDLMRACEELAMNQLVPDEKGIDVYRGPVNLLSDAYSATDSLGSTTVLTCALDNMSKIHGKVHSMIAVLSIGDCELLLLRRNPNRHSRRDLEAIFHTEMQRIDGHAQTPLQVARVDERIDADFDDDIALEVIREGSAVHCLTAHEGDVVVLGSDGVFDNMFIHEIVHLVNSAIPPPPINAPFTATPSHILRALCEKIIYAAHEKSGPDGKSRSSSTPIGAGGKVDDTSVIVAQVVEWTEAHRKAMREARSKKRIRKFLGCVGGERAVDCWYPPPLGKDTVFDEDGEEEDGDSAYETETESEEEDDDEGEGEEKKCVIM